MIAKDAPTFQEPPARSAQFVPAEAAALRAFALLLAAALTLGALGLGNHDLWTPDEPRVAGISREMWKTGIWAVPQLTGRDFLEHPPLFYLTQVAVFSCFGDVSAALARLPAALFSLLALAFTVLLGLRFFSYSSCVAAGLLLLTTWTFVQRSHTAIVDSALLCGVVGALACFAHAQGAQGRERKAWLVGTAAGLGVAFFSKGSVGLVIPLLGIGTYLLWTRRLREFLLEFTWIGAALGALTAIWLWRLWLEAGSDGVSTFVIKNQIGRFIPHAVDYRGGHVRPFYHYLLSLTPQFAPWTPLAALAIVGARRHWKQLGEPQRAGLVMIASVFVPNFAILSIAGTKRGLYLLPLAPCMALLVGWWMTAELPAKRWEQWLQSAWRRIVLCAATLLPAAPLALGEWSAWPWAGVSVALAALSVGFERRAGLAPRFAWYGTIAVVMVAVASALIALPPIFDREKNLQLIVREVDELVPATGTFCAYRPSETLRGLVSFYTDRSLCVVGNSTALNGRAAPADPFWLVVENSHGEKGVRMIQELRSDLVLLRQVGEGERALYVLGPRQSEVRRGDLQLTTAVPE